MDLMIVDVPETIAHLLSTEPTKRLQQVMEGLVIGAYTQGIVSRGRAGELLGLDYWESEKILQNAVFMAITI